MNLPNNQRCVTICGNRRMEFEWTLLGAIATCTAEDTNIELIQISDLTPPWRSCLLFAFKSAYFCHLRSTTRPKGVICRGVGATTTATTIRRWQLAKWQRRHFHRTQQHPLCGHVGVGGKWLRLGSHASIAANFGRGLHHLRHSLQREQGELLLAWVENHGQWCKQTSR